MSIGIEASASAGSSSSVVTAVSRSLTSVGAPVSAGDTAGATAPASAPVSAASAASGATPVSTRAAGGMSSLATGSKKASHRPIGSHFSSTCPPRLSSPDVLPLIVATRTFLKSLPAALAGSSTPVTIAKCWFSSRYAMSPLRGSSPGFRGATQPRIDAPSFQSGIGMPALL